MNTDRIKEIHQKTAFPESQSVYVALMQVWNECAQEQGAEVGKAVAEERERCKAIIHEYDGVLRTLAMEADGRDEYNNLCERIQSAQALSERLFPEPTEKGAANG